MKEEPDQDVRWMRQALDCALRGWGTTHPNPMVGAVIVEDSKVVGMGWHERAGEAHAEVAALRNLGRKPRPGATLYVSLEPCSTQGRTGACTDAVLAAGIRRVVVAADDPNPAHAGRAYSLLRAAGVDVTTGVLAEEATRLNLIFNHWITHGGQSPFLAAKLALTLDGKMATRNGHSRWITGQAARQDVMRWRGLFPAIVAGSGTVKVDDPSLTVRDYDGRAVSCPRRYILDRSAATLLEDSKSYQVYNDEYTARTTLVTERLTRARRMDVAARGIRCVELESNGRAVQFWADFRRLLVADGVVGALVEPGPRLFGDLLAARGVDYGIFYLAPKLIADAQAAAIAGGQAIRSMEDALVLREPRTTVFGPDVRVDGYFDFFR